MTITEWRCPACGEEVWVRDGRTGYCLPCLIPSRVKKAVCGCGRKLLKENSSKKKLGIFMCFRCQVRERAGEPPAVGVE